MKTTLNEKFLAYLALLSGISLSIVAEYYSILVLTAIFSAAVIPVIVMGIVLGVGKVTATLWLKQNWNIAPWSIRIYLLSAIAVLMLITSMGIFGFLSKAHSDQSLVSGDVMAKIAVYDEKIKIAKENIDANRKALKQMDEAVDQVMGRSTSETGADKAVSIRRGQAKERARLQTEIASEQKTIAELNEVRAPISAEVRKVEAEVGPIKYIAAFVYGDTNDDILEKAVTWVIIILIVVFDPLAVILLLSSQISFQSFREKELAEGDSPKGSIDIVEEQPTVTGFVAQEVAEVIPEAVIVEGETVSVNVEKVNQLIAEAIEEMREAEVAVASYEPDDGPLTNEQIEQLKKSVEAFKEEKSIIEQHPYLNQPFSHFKDLQPMVYKLDPTPPLTDDLSEIDVWNKMISDAEKAIQAEVKPTVKETSSGEYVEIAGQRISKRALPAGYVQNEEQTESGKWKEINKAVQITEEEYLARASENRNEQNNTNNAS
jgi:hypothetical protein